ncbi:hypothetical protein ACIQZG_04600 [Lysinibacillus sp. NPDC096418]|uniref:hypothetical protein n=1 Tax=Lysinibacillus sp. NPDC096418 TaxID=3364138 RepID=UPI00381649E8
MSFEEKKQLALMLQNDLGVEQKAIIFDLLCGKYFGRCDDQEKQFIFSVKQVMDMREYKAF